MKDVTVIDLLTNQEYLLSKYKLDNDYQLLTSSLCNFSEYILGHSFVTMELYRKEDGLRINVEFTVRSKPIFKFIFPDGSKSFI